MIESSVTPPLSRVPEQRHLETKAKQEKNDKKLLYSNPLNHKKMILKKFTVME